MSGISTGCACALTIGVGVSVVVDDIGVVEINIELGAETVIEVDVFGWLNVVDVMVVIDTTDATDDDVMDLLSGGGGGGGNGRGCGIDEGMLIIVGAD